MGPWVEEAERWWAGDEAERGEETPHGREERWDLFVSMVGGKWKNLEEMEHKPWIWDLTLCKMRWEVRVNFK